MDVGRVSALEHPRRPRRPWVEVVAVTFGVLELEIDQRVAVDGLGRALWDGCPVKLVYRNDGGGIAPTALGSHRANRAPKASACGSCGRLEIVNAVGSVGKGKGQGDVAAGRDNDRNADAGRASGGVHGLVHAIQIIVPRPRDGCSGGITYLGELRPGRGNKRNCWEPEHSTSEARSGHDGLHRAKI